MAGSITLNAANTTINGNTFVTTANAGDNSTRAASTAFVQTANDDQDILYWMGDI
jgi:hypothetical protein